jgi:hypothetical protein
MKGLLSLREDPVRITEHCIESLCQATGESRTQAARHTSAVRLLVEGLADSLNTLTPQGFMDAVDACRDTHATVPASSPFPLSGIIAALEETVME